MHDSHNDPSYPGYDLSKFTYESDDEYAEKAREFLTFGQVRWYRTVGRAIVEKRRKDILQWYENEHPTGGWDRAERATKAAFLPEKRTPALARLDRLRSYDDADQLLSRAVHCHVLRPKEFPKQYVVGGPINFATGKPYGRDTNKYRNWEALRAYHLARKGVTDSRTCISWTQFDTVVRMHRAIKSHPEAVELLSNGLGERILRTAYLGVQAQIRLDWFNPDPHPEDLAIGVGLGVGGVGVGTEWSSDEWGLDASDGCEVEPALTDPEQPPPPQPPEPQPLGPGPIPGRIVELKTVYNVGQTIGNRAWDRHIHAQAAFNQQIFSLAMSGMDGGGHGHVQGRVQFPRVFVILAEKRFSARVEVFELDQWRLDQERVENELAIREFLLT